MSNQNQNKLKILRDDIGNLVVETANGAFVAIPVDKNLTATAASAANSITKGSAGLINTFFPKKSTMVASAISSINLNYFNDERAYSPGRAFISNLSPSAFLTRIQQEFSNTGYIYLKLENGDKEVEQDLVFYIAIPAILISEREKIYKLTLTNKSTQEKRNIFQKIVTRLRKSSNWLIESDISAKIEEISCFLLPKNSNQSINKIKAANLVNKTFEKAFTGDYSGE